MNSELDLRKAICEVGRRLYQMNMCVATDGNISIRLAPGRFLCTPSGVSKCDMQPNDILIADAQGNKLSGGGKVTSEFFTHLAAYEGRDDIGAVVHAHPPVAIGFTLAGLSMADCVLPEVVYTIGGIPTADYATPGTQEGAPAIRELIKQCDALMLDRHGAVTVGADVWDALRKMEKIEHAALSLWVAHSLGNVRKLGEGQIEKLQAVRVAYGVSGRAYPCGDACAAPSPGCNGEDDSNLDRVVQETLRILGRHDA